MGVHHTLKDKTAKRILKRVRMGADQIRTKLPKLCRKAVLRLHNKTKRRDNRKKDFSPWSTDWYFIQKTETHFSLEVIRTETWWSSLSSSLWYDTHGEAPPFLPHPSPQTQKLWKYIFIFQEYHVITFLNAGWFVWILQDVTIVSTFMINLHHVHFVSITQNADIHEQNTTDTTLV